MRARIYALAFFSLALAGAAVSAHRTENRRQVDQGAAGGVKKPSPVVIELFTSEGCSSCPPADKFLRNLERNQPIPGVEIIALEEHVDYWNHDGWQDPFSGQEWTLRQQEYVQKFKGETPYTPQFILNGEKVLQLKSNEEVGESIVGVTKEEQTEVSISATADRDDTEKVEVSVGSLRGAREQDKADIWIAVTESGLQSNVKAGENNGRTLEHSPVVRSLQKIGTAEAKNSAPSSARALVKMKSNWKKENLRVVVLVQDRKSWRILGAASAKMS